jgi:hypothetical protein
MSLVVIPVFYGIMKRRNRSKRKSRKRSFRKIKWSLLRLYFKKKRIESGHILTFLLGGAAIALLVVFLGWLGLAAILAIFIFILLVVEPSEL